MDAYVASGRIVRARPRLVAMDHRAEWQGLPDDSPTARSRSRPGATGTSRDATSPTATAPAAAAETETGVATIVEAVDRATVAQILMTAAPSLGDRWSAVRERWSQLTFYLSDSNAWR